MCAGLAAARQLDSFGYRVIIVEGHDRPGGRVYTKQLKVSSYLPKVATCACLVTTAACGRRGPAAE